MTASGKRTPCAICGVEFDIDTANLGYNMGAEAEYCCPKCVKPAKSEKQVIDTIKTFMGLKGKP